MCHWHVLDGGRDTVKQPAVQSYLTPDIDSTKLEKLQSRDMALQDKRVKRQEWEATYNF